MYPRYKTESVKHNGSGLSHACAQQEPVNNNSRLHIKTERVRDVVAVGSNE